MQEPLSFQQTLRVSRRSENCWAVNGNKLPLGPCYEQDIAGLNFGCEDTAKLFSPEFLVVCVQQVIFLLEQTNFNFPRMTPNGDRFTAAVGWIVCRLSSFQTPRASSISLRIFFISLVGCKGNL